MSSRAGLLQAVLLPLCLAVSAQSEVAGPHTSPPPTRIEVVVDTLHGVAIPDPYRWLEDGASPETREWIERQDTHARAMLDAVPALPQLRARLSELMRIDRIGDRPIERGDRLFSWKKKAGDDLWILYLRAGPCGEDRVLLDPHLLSEDHTTNVELLSVSQDGRYLAYGVREGGEDEIEVRILDVEERRDLADRLPRALYTGVDFTRGNAGIIYGRHDRASGTRILRHEIGADASADIALFGEGFPPDKWISCEISEDGRYLLILVYHGWARSEVYLKDLIEDGPIETVVNDVDALFMPEFAGNQLIVQTDWDAPNRRLLSIDPSNLDREAWTEILPEGQDPIEGFSAVGGRIFVHYLRNVISQIEMLDPTGRWIGEIEPPGLGSASVPFGNWQGRHAFYTYQSFTTPRTIFRLDFDSPGPEIWGRDSVAFSPDDYVERQVWFESKDGTRVPMFLAHREDLDPTGDHPTLLYGYGGFNVSLTPYFSTMVASWIERGGVYAHANIRGGGEFGEAWHRAGMLENKQNAFDDFIAAAEWLIANRYTNPSRLAIAGGSNGGLLVGAALTQRPELFQAVVCEYPDLDMIGYHRFPNHNAPALAEYGDASDPEQFRFLYAYSPYQMVRDRTAYPAVLLITGDADTRVPPLQARKMAARLQAATTSQRPVLLLYDTKAGHAGGAPMDKQIEDTTYRLAFLSWQLGLTAGKGAIAPE